MVEYKVYETQENGVKYLHYIDIDFDADGFPFIPLLNKKEYIIWKGVRINKSIRDREEFKRSIQIPKRDYSDLEELVISIQRDKIRPLIREDAYSLALRMNSDSLYDWSLSGGTPECTPPNPFIPFGIYRKLVTVDQINEWLVKNPINRYNFLHYVESTKEGINILYELLRSVGFKLDKKIFDSSYFVKEIAEKLRIQGFKDFLGLFLNTGLVCERSLVDPSTLEINYPIPISIMLKHKRREREISDPGLLKNFRTRRFKDEDDVAEVYDKGNFRIEPIKVRPTKK